LAASFDNWLQNQGFLMLTLFQQNLRLSLGSFIIDQVR
jgi:hypothetical protein